MRHKRGSQRAEYVNNHPPGTEEGVEVEDVTFPGAKTDKAVLVKVAGYDHWVPRSQIHAQTEDTITVSAWFAKKAGWR